MIAIMLSGGMAWGQSPAPAPVAQAATAPAVGGGTIHGVVRAGTVPLPGVAVTATNTLTGKKYTTSTDINGSYAMTIPKTGRYVVRAELAAFAAETKEVRLTAEATDQTAEFAMQLASRVAQQEQAADATSTGALTGSASRANRQAALERGLQSLNVTGIGAEGEAATADASAAGGGQAGAALPSLAGLGTGDGSDSVTVSGQMGQTNGLANMNEDEMRQRIQDAMERARQQGGETADQLSAVAGMLAPLMNGGGFGGSGGGSRGGGGGRGGGGRGGGGGGFRGFNPSQPHGAIFWVGSNNLLNAAPFSISGDPVANPAGYQNSFGLSFVGSPFIPGLVKASSKQFIFFNVTGTRNINAQIFNGTVPTVAERSGDFSALGSTLYDPATGLPFAGNVIPTSPTGCPAGHLTCSTLSPAALALLKYYPAPNVSDVGSQGYNYQTLTTAGSNSTAASLRFVRNLGNAPAFGARGGGRRQQGGPATLRQNINFNGSYSHSASDQRNIFLPLGGTTATTGYATTAGYTIGYGRLTNNATLTWNRSNTSGRNYFTNGSSNPYLDAGLEATQNTQNPFFFGLPNLSFTGFTGLSQAAPSEAIGQTISFSDFVSYSHKRHNMRFGLDIRRVHADSLGGANPLGTLTFTGYATGAPGTSQTASSGSGFADFLIGLPQQSAIQASLQKTYLRENVYDWYAQDDWRMRGGLTLNFGLRYEYFGPYTEKNNRLVNLDHTPDFSAVAPVTPGEVGPYQGRFNRSLVNPDHTMYAPRFGFAYRMPSKYLPTLTKDVIVRGGYGVNYNTGQYASFAKQLAFQPPFALTQTNSVTTPSISGTAGCMGATPTTAANLTLTNPYGCSTVAVTNNYSVNKNYRLGHLQTWSLGVQKTLPLQTVLNIDYNGTVGGALDIVRAPNRSATGLNNPDAQAYQYEDSLGFSRMNALLINLRKRQQKGVSVQATYWYRHSLDNASSIGGTKAVPAQNDLDLNAEEGNSSFVVRHQLTGNWVLELPVGPNRALLNKGGFWSRALDGFNLSGTYTFASGTYFTPNYTGTVSEVASGVVSSSRPDRNFNVPVKGPGHLVRKGPSCLESIDSCWFNPAAFSAPAAGVYGNASRGDIEGPGTVTVSSALSRTLTFGGTRSFEMRMTAANVFNTVQYTGINTTLNSPTFGEVTGAAARRSLSFTGRYRF
ncbi:TonB-dependent receptor [Granulicella sp. WH15]|uniref:TonB-dependent receptor n=1 Tax=Granulicella sp. WH15 TaxID=2602070 RepID=UPI00210735B8|nr:TonB-dependent receptor [Granulicella sp. WH15]